MKKIVDKIKNNKKYHQTKHLMDKHNSYHKVFLKDKQNLIKDKIQKIQ